MNADGGLPSWRQVRLLDLVSIRNGQVDPKDPRYRDLPLIAPDHIAPGTGQLLARESAKEQGAISGKYLVEPGDVIYSKIRPYLQKAYKCDFKALCSADMYPLTPRDGVSASFILHTLLGRDFTEFAVSVSARSGIPKINRVELSEFELLAPPPSQQEAVGSYLDDADKIIESLDHLIAKKQAVKQGMMQQLLGGQMRLPGFSQPPLAGVLGDIADVVMGQSPLGASYNRSGIGVALINGPTEFTGLHPVARQWTTDPVRFCQPNDVLICVRGSST